MILIDPAALWLNVFACIGAECNGQQKEKW